LCCARRFQQSTRASLQERDIHLRAILENSTDGVIFADPQSHQILDMNSALTTRIGLQNTADTEIAAEAFFDPADDLSPLFEAAEEERPYSGYHRLRLADGSLLDVEVASFATDYRGAKTVCLVTHDISQWKDETNKLIAVEERLQHLLRSSPAVIYSRPLNDPFGFSFVSASVENFLGLSVADLLSDRQVFKWRIHMEDLPRVMGEQQRVLRSGKQAQEYRIQNGDGEYRWIRDETFLISDGGNPAEIVGTIVDVTSRIEAEQSRMRVETQLEEQKALSMRGDRLRSLGEMAAGMAHELSQPLVGVRGTAEYTLIGLDRGWDVNPKKLAECQKAIIEQADRMVHIIDHVRLFAREAGKPVQEAAAVNDIVRSSLNLLENQLRSRSIVLKTALAEKLPDVFVNPTQ
jgi:PAS domain S-box-containing protein